MKHYWSFIQPKNRELEESLDNLDLQRLKEMDANAWYEFLENEYFRWKYTAANRHATTVRYLRRYQPNSLSELDKDKRRQLLDLGRRTFAFG